MPPRPKVNKEKIIDASMKIIKNEGLNFLNARNIAKYLLCSTQPIFSIYENMDELKKDIYKAVVKYYRQFVEKYIDKSDYLFTMSLAYEEFARLEKKFFEVMYMSKLQRNRTFEEVINSSWNRKTIEATTKQYNVSLKEAENLYRNVRFFTHGLATQIYSESIDIPKKEVEKLIRNAIEKFLN
jgi:hypothetical protein